MRYSANESDPGYWNWAKAMDAGFSVHVFLDGVELKFVEMSDDEAGIAVVAKEFEDGSIRTVRQLDRIPKIKLPNGKIVPAVSIEGTDKIYRQLKRGKITHELRPTS